MADRTVDRGPWTGCAVMFLQSLYPGVNLLSLFKDREQGKFIIFKVIKLTLIGELSHPNSDERWIHHDTFIFLDVTFINRYFTWSDSAGGLSGYEILKVHDADPFLGVEVKFEDVSACQRFLESYSSGLVRQSLSQHACRLLTLPQEFTVETQLKASEHILDLCLDKLELCLQHIHLSQVHWAFLLVYSLAIWDGAAVSSQSELFLQPDIVFMSAGVFTFRLNQTLEVDIHSFLLMKLC